jgi:hypothetical protein
MVLQTNLLEYNQSYEINEIKAINELLLGFCDHWNEDYAIHEQAKKQRGGQLKKRIGWYAKPGAWRNSSATIKTLMADFRVKAMSLPPVFPCAAPRLLVEILICCIVRLAEYIGVASEKRQ